MLYIIQEAITHDNRTVWQDYAIKTKEQWLQFYDDHKDNWVLLPRRAMGKYLSTPENANPNIEHYYALFSSRIWRVTIVSDQKGV